MDFFHQIYLGPHLIGSLSEAVFNFLPHLSGRSSLCLGSTNVVVRELGPARGNCDTEHENGHYGHE